MQINLVCSPKTRHQNLCTSEVRKCKGGKHSRVRLTEMAASNALGEFVIGKSASPRCFKHVRNLPCRYRSQKKAWMDGTLYEEWLHQLDRKFEMQGKKAAVIVDNCPAHQEVSGLKAINLQLLPPNTTSCTYSMDQGLIWYACFIIFLFYQQNQSNYNRMFRFCCRRSSLFRKIFDYKDASVRHRRKS